MGRRDGAGLIGAGAHRVRGSALRAARATNARPGLCCRHPERQRQGHGDRQGVTHHHQGDRASQVGDWAGRGGAWEEAWLRLLRSAASHPIHVLKRDAGSGGVGGGGGGGSSGWRGRRQSRRVMSKKHETDRTPAALMSWSALWRRRRPTVQVSRLHAAIAVTCRHRTRPQRRDAGCCRYTVAACPAHALVLPPPQCPRHNPPSCFFFVVLQRTRRF